jgi:hypothetical protein
MLDVRLFQNVSIDGLVAFLSAPEIFHSVNPAQSKTPHQLNISISRKNRMKLKLNSKPKDGLVPPCHMIVLL